MTTCTGHPSSSVCFYTHVVSFRLVRPYMNRGAADAYGTVSVPNLHIPPYPPPPPPLRQPRPRLGRRIPFHNLFISLPSFPTPAAMSAAVQLRPPTAHSRAPSTPMYLSVEVPQPSRRSLPDIRSPGGSTMKVEYACRRCRARIAQRSSIVSWVSRSAPQ